MSEGNGCVFGIGEWLCAFEVVTLRLGELDEIGFFDSFAMGIDTGRRASRSCCRADEVKDG